MWRISDVLLNCVSTYMCLSPELMQLLIGISTMRYLPPSGTAGFERSFVSGKRRVPAPPPMMMASVLSVGAERLLEVMGKKSNLESETNSNNRNQKIQNEQAAR